MKGLCSLAAATILLPTSAIADYGAGYGMTGVVGASLFGIAYFAVLAFLFSAIFWLTYKWIVGKKGK